MSGVTLVADVTHNNIAHLPAGHLGMGYTTGTPDIQWTGPDWTAHPGAVRICQDTGSDHTADIIDMERGAATIADVITWAPKAQASFHQVKRPGQRWPAAYLSLSDLTPLANALQAAGISDFPLVIARWDNNESADAADIMARTGPWPTVGFQYTNAGLYDLDVFATAWLATVSHTAVTSPKPYHVTVPNPGWWEGPGVFSGHGTDAQQWHTSTPDGVHWSTPARG